jgi:FHS family glucose/mannose:H+ symporter-like MFS transporter
LPLWGYHLHPDYGVAGNYFLFIGAGIAAGGALAQKLAQRMPLAKLLAGGCAMGALGLGMIAFAAPPAQIWYQALALLVAGTAAGIVNTAVLEGVSASYESDPASVTLAAGIFFGAGSVLAAMVMAQAIGNSGAARLILIAALLPAAAAFSFSRLEMGRTEVTKLSIDQSVRDLSSALAVMFAMLLFFQFANEWLIAGWLPVFLIDREGMSPASAVSLLALYWTALTAGRIVAAKLLPRVHHGRMLGLSAFFALFGCFLIAFGSSAGVVLGLLLTGGGFSAIYPLAAERIATRFSYYHPGYFNGIFTFALMGGILSPFARGHVAMTSGLNAVPVAAMIGSCAVFALVLLIWLGRKVSGH